MKTLIRLLIWMFGCGIGLIWWHSSERMGEGWVVFILTMIVADIWIMLVQILGKEEYE
jgi:hypothetical protein